MAIKHYHDFVLTAEDVEVGVKGLVKSFKVHVFDSPTGQGEREEIVNVPDELYKQLRWLEGRNLDEDVGTQMALGETLAGLLLPAYARQLFRESLKRIGDDEGLRLRLRLDNALGNFPWEYIYIHDGRGERTSSGFLALDPRISIARHEAIAVPGDWFRSPGKRRVVVAMATPKPHDRYRKLVSLPVEQKALRAAMDKVAGIEPVFVPIYKDSPNGEIAGVTIKELMFALMKRTDVFHFSGHGDFIEKMGIALGSKVGEGSIVLADESNEAVMLPADHLAEVLKSKGIRLVMLGACETGRRDGQNVWSSVVASLLKAGIPAVVAMQFTINDALAAAFSEAFYCALVAGLWIDEAVAVGRLAVRAEALKTSPDIRDWGVPVLYLRASGGAVFNPVSDTQAVQEANDRIGQLIEQEVREVSSTGRMIGAAIESLKSGTVEVKQRIKERASGVVIGSYAFNVEGGQLVVRQEADTVDGTLIGAMLGNVGGSSNPADEREAMERLQELLQIQVTTVKDDSATEWAAPSATAQPYAATVASSALIFCPQCSVANDENAKYCSSCGSNLSSVQNKNDEDAELAT
jgi:CHAT domain